MVMMTWLASVLRNRGLKVEEIDGWETRGRGEMTSVRGILIHHTGGPLKGDRPSLNLVINGRKDLAGPLSQLFLTRAGVWVVIAAGRCNHAGAGAWHGVTAGNSSFIGVEAENAGTVDDAWPSVQMDAYQRGCAAILEHLGVDEVWVAGHREFALPKGRKIDPLFDMDQFREDVAAMLDDRHAPPSTVNPDPIQPKRLMLRKGSQGDSVKVLQFALGKERIPGMPMLVADGGFGAMTEQAVKIFQRAKGLTADGVVGPATWKILGL